ncbi:hypothetical protein Prum_042850 [Phytohabitans rumicis]|uniref:Uncharacterized protein n=1 Tax=Phytohabitans rumicis TaxID=1076125 RepID=A0A6V8KZZ2_9ACTN|nr:hypothetical protein Prum_042850 [Phytohabitans rumicis]
MPIETIPVATATMAAPASPAVSAVAVSDTRLTVPFLEPIRFLPQCPGRTAGFYEGFGGTFVPDWAPMWEWHELGREDGRHGTRDGSA